MIPATLLQRPQIRLHGKIGDTLFDSFLQQFDAALTAPTGPVLLELTTTGGDAETGRRIADDVRMARERFGADMHFVGKSVVYSAGVSVMGGFPPSQRYLQQGCMLLIHERRLDKTLALKGAMRAMEPLVRDVLAEIESARAMERQAFGLLVEDTALSLDTLMDRIERCDWYLDADEALQHGLIGAVL